MNDVTTITPGVAMRELHHGGEKTLPSVSSDDSAAADEFRDHSEPYQRGKHDRHQGIEIHHVSPRTNPDHNQYCTDRDRAHRRPQKITFQTFDRSFAPCQQWAHRGQQQQQ